MSKIDFAYLTYGRLMFFENIFNNYVQLEQNFISKIKELTVFKVTNISQTHFIVFIKDGKVVEVLGDPYEYLDKPAHERLTICKLGNKVIGGHLLFRVLWELNEEEIIDKLATVLRYIQIAGFEVRNFTVFPNQNLSIIKNNYYCLQKGKRLKTPGDFSIEDVNENVKVQPRNNANYESFFNYRIKSLTTFHKFCMPNYYQRPINIMSKLQDLKRNILDFCSKIDNYKDEKTIDCYKPHKIHESITNAIHTSINKSFSKSSNHQYNSLPIEIYYDNFSRKNFDFSVTLTPNFYSKFIDQGKLSLKKFFYQKHQIEEYLKMNLEAIYKDEKDIFHVSDQNDFLLQINTKIYNQFN